MKKKLVSLLSAAMLLCALCFAAPAQAASPYKKAKELQAGKTYSIDLYKGGKKETLAYVLGKGNTRLTFRIDGKKATVNIPRDQMEYKCIEAVYCADINKKDKYTELIVWMSEPSNSSFCIYRWNGKTLTQCKFQQYSASDGKTLKKKELRGTLGTTPKTDGKGNLKLEMDGNTSLGCFYYDKTFKLAKGSSTLKETTRYASCGNKVKGKATRSFKAYASKSKKAKTFTVRKGATVRVLKTDFKWFKIKAGSKTGWLCVEETRHAPNQFMVWLDGVPVWG